MANYSESPFWNVSEYWTLRRSPTPQSTMVGVGLRTIMFRDIFTRLFILLPRLLTYFLLSLLWMIFWIVTDIHVFFKFSNTQLGLEQNDNYHFCYRKQLKPIIIVIRSMPLKSFHISLKYEIKYSININVQRGFRIYR